MGARVYAPDLGIWTSADPVLVNSPERVATSDFATANPYAYANLNPVAAADQDGNFVNILIGAAIGAVIGAAVGGGIEAARQYIANGKVEDWGRVGAAAAAGGIGGAITGACPAAGLASVMAVGAESGVASGVTQRLVESGGQSAGTLKDVAIDATVGAASAGLAKGMMAVGKAVVQRVAPRLAPVVKGPPASRELAQSVANVEKFPMRFKRTVAVLETREGPTLVSGGASDLSMAQEEFARKLGLTPAPRMPGHHAEPTAIYGAGDLGLTPTRGATSNQICTKPGGCADTIKSFGGRLTSTYTFEF
jgi:RHS repeat-associated protein